MYKGSLKCWFFKSSSEKAFRLTRRYSPLRGPTSSSCKGLWPSGDAFFALRAKKRAYYAVLVHFGNCWCPLETMVTFSSNLKNFERNSKKPKK